MICYFSNFYKLRLFRLAIRLLMSDFKADMSNFPRESFGLFSSSKKSLMEANEPIFNIVSSIFLGVKILLYGKF